MNKHVNVDSVARVISPSALGSAVARKDLTNNITLPITALYDSQHCLSAILIAKLQEHTIPRAAMQLLGIILPNYQQLSMFTIKNCRIDMYVVHELGKMLPYTTITDLCLDGCPLKQANYEELLQNTRIKNLSLCRCNINDEVCERIAATLHYLEPAENCLATLNLSSNCIGDEGAKYFADALRSNRHLRYLNLADNHISDEGASLLFNILIEFPLTYDENIKRGQRLMAYLKKKREIYLENLRNIAFQKSAASIHSSTNKLLTNDKIQVVLTPKRTQSSLSRSSHSQVKRIPSKRASIKTFSASTQNLIEDLPKKAKSVAGDVLGPFVDPFCLKSVTVEDHTRCIGNFVLCYLNLAHNNLTYFSVRKLLSVVQYQNDHYKPDARGLLKVVLDGNSLPVACTELVTIQNLLRQHIASFENNKASKTSGLYKGVSISKFRH